MKEKKRKVELRATGKEMKREKEESQENVKNRKSEITEGRGRN
jgi:hypothetical protein